MLLCFVWGHAKWFKWSTCEGVKKKIIVIMNNDDNDDTCCPMGPHPNLLLLTGSDKVQTATKHTRRCMQERVILMRKPFFVSLPETHTSTCRSNKSAGWWSSKRDLYQNVLLKKGKVLRQQEHRDRYINRVISLHRVGEEQKAVYGCT